MLDKTSQNWQQAPWWVKVGLFAIMKRKTALTYEYTAAALGVLFTVLTLFVNPVFWSGLLLFAVAYWYAVSIRWVDNHKLWQAV